MKDWKDITLGQYNKIKDLLAEQDEYTTFNLLDLIYCIDSANMQITEFGKYANALNFLATEVPTVDLKEQYTINGTVYNSNFNLTTLTAAQFIDYQNYVKDNRTEDYLSVFFIPDGHTYNDGYDIKKVKQDMLDLDFPTAKSIAFFFTIQLGAFLKHFQLSSKKTAKKTKNHKMLEEINKADWEDLVASLYYLLSQKKPTLD